MVADVSILSSITAVSSRSDRSAYVEFSHCYLANAAFSLLRQQQVPLWTVTDDISQPKPVNNSLFRQTEVIDLTLTEEEDTAAPKSTVSTIGDDFLGGFSRAVYEESVIDSESEGGSSSSERIPSPPFHDRDNRLGDFQIDQVQGLESHSFKFPESGTAAVRTRGPSRRPRHTQTGGFSMRRVAPTELPPIGPDNPGIHVVAIPKSPHNSARRVLLPQTTDLPITTVSMRADIQFFHRKQRWLLSLTQSSQITLFIHRYRISKYSIPNHNGYRHVVDAVIARDTAVVAYSSGPFQISLISLIQVRIFHETMSAARDIDATYRVIPRHRHTSITHLTRDLSRTGLAQATLP